MSGRKRPGLRRLGAALACGAVLLAARCLSLDPFLFDGKPLDSYELDGYTGEQECADAIDSIRAMEAADLLPPADTAHFHLLRIPSGNGTIAAMFLSPRPVLDSSDTVIVYFHGNASHIDYYWPRARLLYATGLPTLVMDYRGFGMSDGQATEVSVEEDGHAAMRYVRDSLGNPRVVVYGFSMGSLGACPVASSGLYDRIVSLVLEAPIGSVATLVSEGAFLSVPSGYFTTFTGDNRERIRNVLVPFLWLHGTDDETLKRETHGLPVWENYGGGEGWWLKIAGGGHGTNPSVMGYGKYIAAVRAFTAGAASTDFPQTLNGLAAVEWGSK